jgi:organic radical activating enzyme
MNIAGTEYSIKGKYLEIFLSGCKGLNKCKGTCQNRELHDFSKGIDWEIKQLELNNKILDNIEMINMLVITGGEPLDQDIEELLEFIDFLKIYRLPICIFTSYSFKRVDHKIKELVNLIKCGPYDETKASLKDVFYFNLQSTNQVLYRKEPNGVWSCI